MSETYFVQSVLWDDNIMFILCVGMLWDHSIMFILCAGVLCDHSIMFQIWICWFALFYVACLYYHVLVECSNHCFLFYTPFSFDVSGVSLLLSGLGMDEGCGLSLTFLIIFYAYILNRYSDRIQLNWTLAKSVCCFKICTADSWSLNEIKHTFLLNQTWRTHSKQKHSATQTGVSSLPWNQAGQTARAQKASGSGK